MKKLLLLVLLTLLVSFMLTGADAKRKRKTRAKIPVCTEGTPYRKCAACGSAVRTEYRDLNVLKNRDDVATDPQTITVDEMRNPDNDDGHFDPDKPVSLTAYVASLDKGGYQESCNCGRSDLRDIHINVVANPSERTDRTKFVVVEITPRWQDKDKFDLEDSDYGTMLQNVKDQIRHKWVKFEGFTLRDIAHVHESETTADEDTPTCTGKKGERKPCVWRATPWEVHPVTKYTVVPAP